MVFFVHAFKVGHSPGKYGLDMRKNSINISGSNWHITLLLSLAVSTSVSAEGASNLALAADENGLCIQQSLSGLENIQAREVCNRGLHILKGGSDNCLKGMSEISKRISYALPVIAKAADMGDPRCASVLGNSYEFGTGVTADKAKAAEQYRNSLKIFRVRGMTNVNNMNTCAKNQNFSFIEHKDSGVVEYASGRAPPGFSFIVNNDESFPFEALGGLIRTTSRVQEERQSIYSHPQQVMEYWRGVHSYSIKMGNNDFGTGLSIGVDNLNTVAGYCFSESGCKIEGFECGWPDKKSCKIGDLPTTSSKLANIELSPQNFTPGDKGIMVSYIKFDDENRLVELTANVSTYEAGKKLLGRYGKVKHSRTQCEPKVYYPARKDCTYTPETFKGDLDPFTGKVTGTIHGGESCEVIPEFHSQLCRGETVVINENRGIQTTLTARWDALQGGEVVDPVIIRRIK